MQKSTYSIVRPIDNVVFRDTIVATISVPPVDPLCMKIIPSEKPEIMPAIVMLMKGWPGTNPSGNLAIITG